MFNSLNALSEDGSLVTMPPWVNPWLLLAMAVSFGLHFVILYVPFLAQVFGIVPLSLNEWLLVLAVSLPVILIDEVLKFVGRLTSGYRGLIITKSLYWALNIPLPSRNAEGGFHFYVAVIVAVICTPVFDLRTVAQLVPLNKPALSVQQQLKSWDDLQKLWYVLLKEKNMLMTQRQMLQAQNMMFPNPERIPKVLYYKSGRGS
ncbi:hypothetical protein DY000_02058073 [Brassica cretica]|uniref:Large ribosomal subunit protein uL29m n=1 Tax=Brassica cretica TaxID=69181 RepID=A0ABQ7ABM4_BRACR|nr:hypothetical protein DY000_02058073 [Brassica cretica]